MSVNINVAANNIFSRRLGRSDCCPIHEKIACVKYIQPIRPQSYRPIPQYNRPDHPLEADTVYHLSYKNFEPETARACRGESVPLRGNIVMPSGPLEKSTVMNLSYMGAYEPPPEPFRPRSVAQRVTGPMQNTTTHSHDYPCKPANPPEKIVPSDNIKVPDAKMAVYSTVTQLSYVQPELPPREIPPWVPRREFQPPHTRMEGNTIYNGSFQAPGIFEPCDTSTTLSTRAGGCHCSFPTATEDL